MNYQTISYEVRGRTGWIYLNRPEALNSLNTQMALELDDVLSKAEADENIRVLAVSGKGRAFCAGADLKAVRSGMEEGETTGPSFLDLTGKALNHLRAFPRPVIAAVNGLALAGGLETVMCCDIVIAAESAKLGDAHSNFGVFPGAGGAAVLPGKVGLNRAKYLLFTGDFITAAEMKDYGIVNQVVPDGELEATVQALADRLADKSPMGLRAMKEVANRSMDQSLEAALNDEQVALARHQRTEDMREGLAAFNEKRKPNFPGR
jgi:enoyl-CoA hydratase/carnithine racemase